MSEEGLIFSELLTHLEEKEFQDSLFGSRPPRVPDHDHASDGGLAKPHRGIPTF